MNKKKVILYLLFFYWLTPDIVAQQEYMVGFGSKSIEPGEDFFSVALQGYGDPVEGRFSLEWISCGNTDNLRSISGNGDYVYSLTNDAVLYRWSTMEEPVTWQKVGSTNNKVLLAGSDPDSYKLIATSGNNIYAISFNNKLWVYDTTQSEMVWTVIGHVPDAVALTSAHGKLYLLQPNGELLEGEMSPPAVEWEKAGVSIPNVVSLASKGNKLYALTLDQRLWETPVDKDSLEWREIAYLNGETYKYPLSHICVANNKLYGVGVDERMYVSRHRTKDELRASSMVIQSGGENLLIVTLDLAAIDYSFTDEIKKLISEEFNIRPTSVLINVSHSHFTPVSKLWFAFGAFGYPDSLYLEKVKNAAIESTREAINSVEKSYLYWGRTESFIGMNRSLADKNSIDSSVDILLIESPRGTPKGLLYSAACHPVSPNTKENKYMLSANFPGEVKRIIRKEYGIRNVMFLQACAGDVNPRLEDDKQTGTVLAFDILKRLRQKMAPVKGKLYADIDEFPAPVRAFTKDEILAIRESNKNRTGDIEAEKNVRWANHLLRYDGKEEKAPTLPIYIQTVNIGNWKIVALSREPVSSYSTKIKNVWPEDNVTVIGYSNDISSYLPAYEHIKQHTYEGDNSYTWYGLSSVFLEDIQERVIQRIKNKN